MLNVERKSQHLSEPIELSCGERLDCTIAYNTYGERSADDSTTVLVLHALTGSADAHEWWSGLIGEGKLLDPSKHFIIAPNAIGSCYGSTGPESIDPTTGKAYLGRFPEITIRDIAKANVQLLTDLGITQVVLGIGGSMGGMVLLEMAALAPSLFRSIIPIAVCERHSPWRVAFSSTIRRTITAFDESLQDRAKLQQGLRIARQFAMTSYRCATEFDGRFKTGEIESYLEHHGDKIVERFSPYSYITLTRAMELYDLSSGRGSIAEVASTMLAKALFVGISSDILFVDSEIRSFAKQLPNAEYRTLFADHGHDSFLVDTEELTSILEPFVLQALPRYEEVTL